MLTCGKAICINSAAIFETGIIFANPAWLANKIYDLLHII